MKAVVGVLVMLLKVCHGVAINCDGRQDKAQCYGALGGTVGLQLMDNASEIHIFQWLKNNVAILSKRTKDSLTVNYNEKIRSRSSFSLSHGTFIINNLSRTDDGQYTLKIYNSEGKQSEKRTLQLTIQAPVSSVLLASECLSQGQMRLSCSSEGGDSPHYNWTLDGHTLTDAKLLSGNNTTNNITLKQDVSGWLVCSVSNYINRALKEESIKTCGFIFINCTSSNGTHISQWVFEDNNTLCIEPTTTSTTITEGKETGTTVSNKPSTNITSSNQTSSITDAPWYKYLAIVAGVLSALVILLVVAVAFASAQRKKQNNKEEKEEQELTYADVRIFRQQGRHTARIAELEVEYSQVKFSDKLRQTAERTPDDCVYSNVREAR